MVIFTVIEDPSNSPWVDGLAADPVSSDTAGFLLLYFGWLARSFVFGGCSFLWFMKDLAQEK